MGHPIKDALVIGTAAIVGSLIPLIPFLLACPCMSLGLSIRNAIMASIALSSVALFFLGFAKAKLTIGNPVRSGAEMMVIGMVAALAGYWIGAALGVAFYA